MDNNKISIGWTLILMFITATLVYSVTTYSYNKAIMGDENYYEGLFALKSYSGEFEKLKRILT